MLPYALQYVELGLKIFPCNWPIENRCSCGKADCTSPGKHPRTPNGFYAATDDARQIKEWWERMPYANIGLRTGAENNILVLDVDPPHGGDASLVKLEEQFGKLPPTLRARTGSGGEHVIFQHVDGLTNCVGAIGDGLDIRTDGGYIVIAPSLHISGRRYEWENNTTTTAAPPWLLDRIRSAGGVSSSPGEKTLQYDYWQRIANGVRKGERHVLTLKLAGLLVGSQRLPATLSLSLLHAFNEKYCDPPLPKKEVEERFSRVVKRQRKNELEYREGVRK